MVVYLVCDQGSPGTGGGSGGAGRQPTRYGHKIGVPNTGTDCAMIHAVAHSTSAAMIRCIDYLLSFWTIGC